MPLTAATHSANFGAAGEASPGLQCRQPFCSGLADILSQTVLQRALTYSHGTPPLTAT
jgi:hypothetical protein